MYHNFADFSLIVGKHLYTHINKFSLKMIKAKVVVYKPFCEGFPNSAAHTS